MTVSSASKSGGKRPFLTIPVFLLRDVPRLCVSVMGSRLPAGCEAGHGGSCLGSANDCVNRLAFEVAPGKARRDL